jgi:hypothetical protein
MGMRKTIMKAIIDCFCGFVGSLDRNDENKGDVYRKSCELCAQRIVGGRRFIILFHTD